MILKLNMLIITAVSAWMDIRWWKIKNQWLAVCLAGGLIYRIFYPDSGGVQDGITGLLLPFLILVLFFVFGKIGAADIKLFCVMGMWAGSRLILSLMFFSVLSGAVYFFVLLIRFRDLRSVLNRRLHVAVFAFISSLLFTGGICF